MTLESSRETTFGERGEGHWKEEGMFFMGLIGVGSFWGVLPPKLVGVSHKITSGMNERSRENRDEDGRDFGRGG